MEGLVNGFWGDDAGAESFQSDSRTHQARYQSVWKVEIIVRNKSEIEEKKILRRSSEPGEPARALSASM